MNVIKLKQEGSKDIVELLEELLKEAKEGRIVDIAVATVTTDAQFFTHYYGQERYASLLGAISVLQYDIISNSG